MGAQDAHRLRTFGRTGGRPLSPRQRKLLEARLPDLSVPQDGDINPVALFGRDAPLWLEIGFGGGEHLAEQASRHPDCNLIGCEPFVEGIAKAVTAIDERHIDNIRLHADDARDVLDRLPRHCLDRVFILFPDPWPKRKHWKRRLIQRDFVAILRDRMKPGGQLRFATDVRSYADWALVEWLQNGGFDWQAARADHWRRAPADHIRTRYEAKRLGDCAPVFFDFKAM